MGDTSWDDVGRSFTELGAKLTEIWNERVADDRATDDLRDAGEKVKSALDEVAESFSRAAGSPALHDAARKATTTVAEALASTLQQVAGHLADAADRARGATDEAPGDDIPGTDGDGPVAGSNGHGDPDEDADPA